MNPPSNEEAAQERPLRLVLPACYQHLLAQFALEHLHPYDVKASAIAGDGGFTIVLRYGEGLTRWKKHTFSHETLDSLAAELTVFYQETAQDCKQTMIADYYKMMKPST